jgi:hypothetical protein
MIKRIRSNWTGELSSLNDVELRRQGSNEALLLKLDLDLAGSGVLELHGGVRLVEVYTAQGYLETVEGALREGSEYSFTIQIPESDFVELKIFPLPRTDKSLIKIRKVALSGQRKQHLRDKEMAAVLKRLSAMGVNLPVEGSPAESEKENTLSLVLRRLDAIEARLDKLEQQREE